MKKLLIIAVLLIGTSIFAQTTTVITGNDGNASIVAPSGTYRFTIESTNPELVIEPAEVIRSVNINAPVAEPVVMTLSQRVYTIPIRVQDAKGNPIPGISVNVSVMAE